MSRSLIVQLQFVYTNQTLRLLNSTFFETRSETSSVETAAKQSQFLKVMQLRISVFIKNNSSFLLLLLTEEESGNTNSSAQKLEGWEKEPRISYHL